jgi:hypothetical protein
VNFIHASYYDPPPKSSRVLFLFVVSPVNGSGAPAARSDVWCRRWFGSYQVLVSSPVRGEMSDVAIKLLLSHQALDPKSLERFKREPAGTDLLS